MGKERDAMTRTEGEWLFDHLGTVIRSKDYSDDDRWMAFEVRSAVRAIWGIPKPDDDPEFGPYY